MIPDRIALDAGLAIDASRFSGSSIFWYLEFFNSGHFAIAKTWIVLGSVSQKETRRQVGKRRKTKEIAAQSDHC
jgi:hypothetical protein